MHVKKLFQMSFLKNIFKKNKIGNQTSDFTVKSLVQEPAKVKKSEPSIEEISNVSSIIFATNYSKDELIQLLAKESIFATGNDIRMGHSFDFGDRSKLLKDAARLLVTRQHGNSKLLQRELGLEQSIAFRIMNDLESAGIIGLYEDSSNVEVFVKTLRDLDGIISAIFSDLNDFEKVDIQLFYDEYTVEIENRKAELLLQISDKKLESEKRQIRHELLEKERKRKLQREVLNELIDEGAIYNLATNNNGKRESVPQEVMDKVWNRDGGKCAFCGSQESIEFDHIIPFSKGGANTYRNLQILCKDCNVKKSNNIG